MKFAGVVWAALRGKRSTACANHMEGNTMATRISQPPHGSPAWFYGCVDRAKTEGVFSERVMLTPALAAELIKQNPNNRFVRAAKYDQLLSDIIEDRWMFNGESILISTDGLLNDGQHRCLSVIEANKAIDTLITFGIPRESRVSVDQGAAKSAGDYMQMDGVENATTLAAIGRLVIAYERADGLTPGDGSRVSSGEIRLRFAADPLMARTATFAHSMHRHARRFAAPAIVGACFYVLSRVDPAKAETYMRQVCMGENIKQKDPAFAVREGLLRERTTRNEKIHLIFRGWNAFRQNKSLTLAKVVGNLPAII